MGKNTKGNGRSKIKRTPADCGGFWEQLEPFVHELQAWRPHRFDNQTTIYICSCLFEASSQMDLYNHIELKNLGG